MTPTPIYPVRNNAPLLPPGQRPSGPAAAAVLDFIKIPAGFNASLEFLTGFTFSLVIRGRGVLEWSQWRFE